MNQGDDFFFFFFLFLIRLSMFKLGVIFIVYRLLPVGLVESELLMGYIP